MTLRTTALVLCLASSAMLAFAYIAQYQFGLLPCLLCLYQRPPHFSAAAFAAFAAVLAGRSPWTARIFLALTALALITGTSLAVFHAGVEWKWWPGLAECGGTTGPLATNVTDLMNNINQTKVVECDKPSFVFLGLSMAGWNAILSAILTVIAIGGIFARRSKA